MNHGQFDPQVFAVFSNSNTSNYCSGDPPFQTPGDKQHLFFPNVAFSAADFAANIVGVG